MTHNRTWALTWTLLRLATAALIVAAVVGQLIVSVNSAIDNGRDVPTTVANFFSFFTILSNVASVIVLTWAALWALTRRGERTVEPRGIALALTSVTAYMILTGVVYNLLLRGIELPQGSTLPWSNEVLHVVAPVFLLLDLFVGPFRRALPWGAAATTLIFPVVWLAYTFIRGPLVTNPATGAPAWYPYPFLDPTGPGGWPSVIGYSVGIAATITVVAFFVVWIGRRRGQM